MENVFEMPPDAPAKKARKPRKPMTPEAKKIFVDRMRASRKKKMEDKIRKEMGGSPLVKTETANEVVNNIIKSPEAPTTKVPQNSPVKSEPRHPAFDYSHFNNLTNNIQLLNDTLTSLSKRDIERNKKAMEAPIKAIEVAIPKAMEAPVKVMEAPVKAMEVPIKVIDDSPPVRQKEKIWNCGKRCFVYR